MDFSNYAFAKATYDEMFIDSGAPRPWAERFVKLLAEFSDEELAIRQSSAEKLLQNLGITFTVYGDDAGTEKIWPFDLVPRIIGAEEWSVTKEGLAQRVEALNLFIDDLYNAQKIVKDGVFPAEM